MLDKAKTQLDPITVEVIGSALTTIVEEMGKAIIRAAYSTNIKERQDCSTALFDAQGRTIAQAEHIPVHLGSLSTAGGVCAVITSSTFAGNSSGVAAGLDVYASMCIAVAANDIWNPGWVTASGCSSRTVTAASARACKLIARRSTRIAANAMQAVTADRSAGGGAPESTR